VPPSRAKGLRLGLGAGVGLLILGAGGYAYNYRTEEVQLARKAEALTGGSVARGKDAFARYGCGGCHSVTGVALARGKVGPALDGLGGRAILAGRLENRPANLMRWIADPRAVDAQTAMPDLGVTRGEARDIAAFLYTRS
jgi:cytochrome c